MFKTSLCYSCLKNVELMTLVQNFVYFVMHVPLCSNVLVVHLISTRGRFRNFPKSRCWISTTRRHDISFLSNLSRRCQDEILLSFPWGDCLVILDIGIDVEPWRLLMMYIFVYCNSTSDKL